MFVCVSVCTCVLTTLSINDSTSLLRHRYDGKYVCHSRYDVTSIEHFIFFMLLTLSSYPPTFSLLLCVSVFTHKFNGQHRNNKINRIHTVNQPTNQPVKHSDTHQHSTAQHSIPLKILAWIQQMKNKRSKLDQNGENYHYPGFSVSFQTISNSNVYIRTLKVLNQFVNRILRCVQTQ